MLAISALALISRLARHRDFRAISHLVRKSRLHQVFRNITIHENFSDYGCSGRRIAAVGEVIRRQFFKSIEHHGPLLCEPVIILEEHTFGKAAGPIDASKRRQRGNGCALPLEEHTADWSNGVRLQGLKRTLWQVANGQSLAYEPPSRSAKFRKKLKRFQAEDRR